MNNPENNYFFVVKISCVFDIKRNANLYTYSNTLCDKDGNKRH